MKKIYHFLTLLLLILSTRVNGQVAGSFDMYSMEWRWTNETEGYLENFGFTNGTQIMSHGAIYGSGDENKVNLTLVRNWLEDNYPSTSSSGYLLLNWETGPFTTMRNNSRSSTAFKTAEAEILKLINGVKSFRPNLKVSMYRMPFRFWTQTQNRMYNEDGKFNNIFAKVDYIAPSVYILKADEEVGHARNIQYIRENLDVALAYGKTFNKPVIPYMWHRVHPFADRYAYEILQKEVLAKYLKFIYTYSYNNKRTSGVVWWDGMSGQLNNLSGINNCLNGTVRDKATYNAMIVKYAKYFKEVLTGTTVPTPNPVEGQKLDSFTLINADNNDPIQTISNGATLNLATLPTRNLNIRANTSPSSVGSVKMVLSGAQSRTQTESSSPYALFAESGGNYSAWVPPTGSYTLKGTPYTASGGSGTAGTALTISFTVVNQSTSNPAPVANAGSDKFITLPTSSVQLSGSGTDSNGSIASYSWSQLSGPNTAVFSSKTTASPTVSSLVAGSYIFGLTVKDNGGATSTTDQVNVTVSSSTSTPGQRVVSFTLINADNDQEIKTIANGSALNLATLPTKNLNIRVNTDPVKVGSVVISLTGAKSVRRTETGAPYSVFGDEGGNYDSWGSATLGNYNLKATPYTASGGGGTAGTALTISFTVVNQTTSNQMASTSFNSMFATEGGYPSADSTAFVIEEGNSSADSTTIVIEEGNPSPDSTTFTTDQEDLYVNPDDNDEAATVQETVVEENDLAQLIAAYPNPATNKLYIKASDLINTTVTIRVFDQMGLAVLTEETKTNESGLDYTLIIAKLKKGRYILQVGSDKVSPVRTHLMVE